MTGSGHTASARGEAFRLALFYGAYFVVMGAYLPFFPVWLSYRGLSANEIGIVIGASAFIRIFAVPPVGFLADRQKKRRFFLVILSVLTLLSFAFLIPESSFGTVLFFAVLAGLFFFAMMPLVDELSVRRAHLLSFDYGRVRLWGSATFIFASIFCGFLLQEHSAEVALWWLLGGAALVCFVSLVLPPDVSANTLSAKRLNLRRGLRILTRPSFLVFLLAAALIQASHAIYYAFGSLHWRSLGLSDGFIGSLWGIGVIAEIALFAMSGRLVLKLGPYGLLLLGASGAVLRWGIFAFDPPALLLPLLQCLHGFSFGATHLAAMNFILRAAPSRVSATAQSLYAAFFVSSLSGFMIASSGFVYSQLAGYSYFVMSGVALLACVLVLMSRGMRKPLGVN